MAEKNDPIYIEIMHNYPNGIGFNIILPGKKMS